MKTYKINKICNVIKLTQSFEADGVPLITIRSSEIAERTGIAINIEIVTEDTADDAIVQSIIDAHNGLEQLKLWKVAILNKQANEIVSKNYGPEIQAGFAALYAAALHDNLTNRTAYIKRLLDWGMGVAFAYNQEKVAVNNLADSNAILNYTWDTTALAAQDPLVTLLDAITITD